MWLAESATRNALLWVRLVVVVFSPEIKNCMRTDLRNENPVARAPEAETPKTNQKVRTSNRKTLHPTNKFCGSRSKRKCSVRWRARYTLSNGKPSTRIYSWSKLPEMCSKAPVWKTENYFQEITFCVQTVDNSGTVWSATQTVNGVNSAGGMLKINL